MKFFTQNLGAKFLALLCALFLWIYVTAGESKVGYFPGNLPIEAKNTPTNLAVVYDEQKVKIKLQAPYETWNKISIDNFGAFIDLAGLEEGTHELEVQVTVNLSNVVIVEKEPSKIIVRLETIAQKEVPVVVKFEGDAASGFVPSEPKVSPEKVKAKGARSLIEALNEATALIWLSGEEEDFTKTVKLISLDEKGEKQKGITFEPESVEVEVPIVAAAESKAVGIKAKLKGKPASGYFVSKIETSPSVVEISGSASALKSILYLETREINIEGIEKNFTKKVGLVFPSKVSSKQKTVLISVYLSPNTIDREITATLVTTGTSLTVNSISPNIVRVVVSGPSETINNLSSTDVVITFDLTGKGAGSHSVNITKGMIQVPSGCVPTSWLPSAVTIVLQ